MRWQDGGKPPFQSQRVRGVSPAESVTHIAETHAEDNVYPPLPDHFSARVKSAIWTFAIGLMNCLTVWRRYANVTHCCRMALMSANSVMRQPAGRIGRSRRHPAKLAMPPLSTPLRLHQRR